MSSADTGTIPPADQTHQAVVDELSARLGEAVVGTELRRGDAWVRVDRAAWRGTADTLRELGFDYFCFLSGIDWMPATAPNPEEGGAEMSDVGDEGGAEEAPEAEAAEESAPAPADEGWQTGCAGGDTRFQVLARVYSTTRKVGITLKADLDDDDPRVDTWAPVYSGADWHERETWEMYGFTFTGHPNLTHLYLPGEFEGFPLRKDFPLLSREVKPWPGLVDVEPMPPEEAPAGNGAPAQADGGGEAG